MRKIDLQIKRACHTKLQQSNGYTILETMIAVSLFVIIITIGMGALLNANLLHRKSEDARSIMDNLSFIMEDMSRNLRTGYDYHCGDVIFTDPQSCPDGEGEISFKSSSGSQWMYQFEPDGGAAFNISRLVQGGDWTRLNSEKISFSSDSGFWVFGAESPLTGDVQQPFVVIKLAGTITSKDDTVTSFSLRTSVSQRLVDI
ncbi:MAG: hypothetical protein UT09_C0025G0007 [Parcubacteria group bacterium GW2011_GWF2_38_8]|nr:MAG: hypothetical protein UT09_C0025G0007 [Parcubacteria group bacterium GW2011_GWF2_38_8]